MKNKAIIIADHKPLFDEIEKKFKDKGIDAAFIEKDSLTSLETAKKLASEAAADGFSYVVYSAFLNEEKFPKYIIDMTVDQWNQWKEDTYIRTYYALQFLTELKNQGEGRFVIVGSGYSEVPAAGQEIQGGASAGAFMDMMAVASELGDDKLTINGFAVGSVGGQDSMSENLQKHIPSHKQGCPSAIASRIVNSMLEEDSFMNGNITIVDGGLSCTYMREW